MTPLLQILALIREGKWSEAHNFAQFNDSSAADWTDGLKKWQKVIGDTPTPKPILIYGGADSHEREHYLVDRVAGRAAAVKGITL